MQQLDDGLGLLADLTKELLAVLEKNMNVLAREEIFLELIVDSVHYTMSAWS